MVILEADMSIRVIYKLTLIHTILSFNLSRATMRGEKQSRHEATATHILPTITARSLSLAGAPTSGRTEG